MKLILSVLIALAGESWAQNVYNPNNQFGVATFQPQSGAPGMTAQGMVYFSASQGAFLGSVDGVTFTPFLTQSGGTVGVDSILGTTNQVNVSNSTGAVTLSLPQSIANTSSPTFGGATITGTETASIISVSSIVITGANSTMTVSKTTAPFTVSINGNGSSPLLCSGTGGCGIVTQNGSTSGTTYWENTSPGGNGRLNICNDSSSTGDRGCIIFLNDSDAISLNPGGAVEALRALGQKVHIGASGNPAATADIAGMMMSTAAYISGTIKVDGQTNFPGIAFSSVALNSLSITATSGFTCSSTVTWTSNGNRAFFKMVIQGSNSGLASSNIAYLLVDGVNQGVQFSQEAEAVANSVFVMVGDMQKLMTAGIHRACVAFNVSAGTFVTGANDPDAFYVQEF